MSQATELYLNYPQSKFKLSKDHFTCIKGTWGCGKSRIALMIANDACEEYPKNLYLIIRKEWVDLRDSTLHDWSDWIGRPINGDKNVIYPNGSVLMFRHGEDLDALKNINLGGCLMVQAEEMSEDDFWFVNGRLRRMEGTRQLHLECNYNGHNWIYQLFNQKKLTEGSPFQGALITTNTFDNEKNLPPDYIPNLKRLPKKLQDRFLYGSDADMEGQIWEMWSEEKHVIKPFTIPDDWERFTVSDTPVASGVLAVTWWAVDDNGTCYIYDEYQEDNRLISQHCESLLLRTGKNKIRQWIADTSAFNKTREKEGQLYSVADEFADYGIILTRAEKDVYAGINRVGEYLEKGKLKIFSNCTLVRDKIPQYRWANLKPNARGEAAEVPYRVDTHLVETVRYGIMSRPQASIIDKSPKVEKGSVAAFIQEDELKDKDWRGKY